MAKKPNVKDKTFKNKSQNNNFNQGIHSVKALLTQHPDQLIELYLQNGRFDQRVQELIQLAKSAHIKINYLPREELDALVGNTQHQGIVAAVQTEKQYHENDLANLLANTTTPPLVLILDGVQDPHNLGACLRSADAAGVHCVIIPKDRAAPLTPTVRKVACGAAESVLVITVTNLARTLTDLKDMGIWLIGAAGEATQSIYQTDFKGPIGIVMGAEEDGLRRLTRDHCDYLAQIPMTGHVESLNVSVATGVFLFEAVRQRQIKVCTT